MMWFHRIAVLFAVMVLCTSQNISFPIGFFFGTATAAYQIEGAYKQDGRGLSIWDTFTHLLNKTYHNQNGDIADDHYNKLEEDIKLMKEMNITHYRMSFSWSRLMTDGTFKTINQAGINHYNREIDLLVKNGIQPFVTLFHWDLPQGLQDQYLGWLNKTAMINAFRNYAELCFSKFGDRVKYWLTVNEPLVVLNEYLIGDFAPGRCTGCTAGGNSDTEPYTAAHVKILCHSVAVILYKQSFQKHQQGKIGITLSSDWAEPLSNLPEDLAAAQRHVEFTLGWFADPIFLGDYPASMRTSCGSRLPVFTPEEKLLLKNGKSDFFAINHYSTAYAAARAPSRVNRQSWFEDLNVYSTHEKDGKPIGPQADSPWLYVVPWGMRKLLNWIHKRYGNLDVYITENGVDVPGESDMPISQALQDNFRINYMNDYLLEVKKALDDGVNIKGYFAWSLMDNFEWIDGYSKRFGLHYVDYDDPNLPRYKKASAKWYSDLIKFNIK